MRKIRTDKLNQSNVLVLVDKRILILCIGLFVFVAESLAQTDYSVLKYWAYYSDVENSLYKQQCDISFQYLQERKKKINALETKEAWLERQQETADIYQKIVGPFPGKTPLNPIVTGKLKKQGYTIEKLFFESMPGYKVTAAFFIPDGKKQKLPTIIFCSGHSEAGFRSAAYQKMILNLVKKGFAVFAFDPIGQGERLQYFEPELGKSAFGPTREHSYPGAQLFINGSSAARYIIWDGIRSVDYLLTRKEVDPARIGITGRSGGGTQTAYIAAFDNRIKAAATECYITSYSFLLKSKGPQDAEQNFFHGLKEGLDMADLLEIRAPKPALLITTTRDMFSIEGARRSYSEAKQAYAIFGAPQNLEMVEDDAGHQSTKKNREAMYAFFQKHLDNPGADEDMEIDLLEPKELFVTETGQLENSIGSKFLFDINAELAQNNQKNLQQSRLTAQQHISNVKIKSTELSGFKEKVSAGHLVFSGRTELGAVFMEKYIIELPRDRVIPFLLFRPMGSFEKLVLYLADYNNTEDGKLYDVPIELAKSGKAVLVPSLPGYGELGPGYLKGDAYFNSTSYNQWFAGVLNGKSMTAIHSEAIYTIAKYFHEIPELSEVDLVGISVGPFCSSLLHTSTFGMNFTELILVNPLTSFSSLVSAKKYESQYIPFAVAGSLLYYDLPDLIAASETEKVIIINPKNGSGNFAETNEVELEYAFAKQYYEYTGKYGGVEIKLSVPEASTAKIIIQSLED